MGVQKFKDNDLIEDKVQAVCEPLLLITDVALDEFFENGYESTPFLLMLYDEGRIPFSSRIKRETFSNFIKEALSKFPVAGTFEFYLFILKNVFGENAEVRFEVTSPGSLSISVEATPNSEFEFIAREFESGVYTFFDMIDDVGDQIIFRGFSGIETQSELELLFSEIVPAGIYPTISLEFTGIYEWEDDSGDSMVDDEDDEIIFEEGEA